MGPRYMGFGSDSFRGVPLKLTTPSTGALATALAALGDGAPAAGVAYRALSAVSVTITDTASRSVTYTHQAGEGYALPVKDIICAGGDVLVFW